MGQLLATILINGNFPSNNPHRVGQILVTTSTARNMIGKYLATIPFYFIFFPLHILPHFFFLGISLDKKASRAELQPLHSLLVAGNTPLLGLLLLENAYSPPVGSFSSAKSIQDCTPDSGQLTLQSRV